MTISHYKFKYDYGYEHECQNGSNCCDNDYCRCGRIVDLKIKSMDVFGVIDEVKEVLFTEIPKDAWYSYPKKITKHKWTDMEEYCLVRLFTIMKMYSVDNWEIEAQSGYYGEEIGDAYIDAENFCVAFNTMMKLSDDDKMRFVLEKEYGYILPELKDAKFEMRIVEYSDILPPIDLRRVTGGCISSGPIGVYKEVGDKYRILDGHHRWAKNRGEKEVAIWVAVGVE